MDEKEKTKVDEIINSTSKDDRFLLSPCSSNDLQTAVGSVGGSSSIAETCAEWVIITLVLAAWVLSVAAFLHKWKRLRILPPRSFLLKEPPKNLEAVTVVDALDQSIIYRSYPVQVAAALQARFSRLTRTVSLRLANLPLIMAATRGRPGTNPPSGDAESREPEVLMMSSLPEETSSVLSGSSLSRTDAETSIQPEAIALLPEVAQSLPEATLWLPEVTLSLAEVNHSRPEVEASVPEASNSEVAVNSYD